MKALSWLFSFTLLGSSGQIVNFDRCPVGKTPPGWTVAMTNRGEAPKWEVRRDGSAPTQPYVLAQLSSDPTVDRFPLAIFDGVKLRDGDLSVRIKPVAGREERAGGLVFRYRDADNYYLVRANALAKTVALFKVENGRRIPLRPEVKHDIPLNGWSILKVSVRGSRFEVYVDHRRVMQGWDSTFTGPGRVGLWTVADSVTYFDDFRVYPK